MTMNDNLIERLHVVRWQGVLVDAEREIAREQRVEAIRQAHEAGMSHVRIARELGVSPQRVEQLLKGVGA